MGWLKVLSALFKISSAIVRKLERDRIISDAEAQMYMKSMKEAHDIIEQVGVIRDNVKPGDVSDDGYRRD